MFTSYSENAQFCSVDCKNRNQTMKVNIEKVRKLYLNNMTQTEIAKKLDVTQKVIFNVMKRNNIKTRKAAPRNQKGDKNNNWKAGYATYSALHIRVEIERGKPNKCEDCGTKKSKKFEWANINGNYNDVQDYKRLCICCHKAFDNRRRKQLGFNTTELFYKMGKECLVN